VAAEGGQVDVLKLLLSSGADVIAHDQVSEKYKSNYTVFVEPNIQRSSHHMLY